MEQETVAQEVEEVEEEEEEEEAVEVEKDDSSDGAVLVNGNEGEDQWGTINCNGHPNTPPNF